MAENSVAPEWAHPGGLGEVVHENVVAFLRIGPEIEDLGNGGDILIGTLPSQVGVHGQASGVRAVVAAQIEHKLEIVVADRPGQQLVLSKVVPGFSGALAGAEEEGLHVVAI